MLQYRSHLLLAGGAVGLVSLFALGVFVGCRAPDQLSLLAARRPGGAAVPAVSGTPAAAVAAPSQTPLAARKSPAVPVTFAAYSRLPLPSYRVVDLGSLGGASDAAAINNQGKVVGSCQTPRGFQAFAWRNGKLARLGGFSACDINDLGQVAGFKEAPGGLERPLLREGKKSIALAVPPGASNAYAYRVNDRGQVVGAALWGNAFVSQALLWTGHRVWPLWNLPGYSGSQANAINNHGQVVGAATAPGGIPHACLWKRGRMVDLGVLSEGLGSQAQGINDSGRIVGSANVRSADGSVVTHAFLWKLGRMSDLGALPGWAGSAASAINNSGQIVGELHPTMKGSNPPATHAFLWQRGQMADLNDLIPAGSGWILFEASAINNRGDIVGSGLYRGERRAFLLTTHPVIGPAILASRPAPKKAKIEKPARIVMVALLPKHPVKALPHKQASYPPAKKPAVKIARAPAPHKKPVIEKVAAYGPAIVEPTLPKWKKPAKIARAVHKWQPPALPIGYQGIVVGRGAGPHIYRVQDGNISRDIDFGPKPAVQTGEEVRVRGVLRGNGTVAAQSIARLGYHHTTVVVASSETGSPRIRAREAHREEDIGGFTDLGGGRGIVEGHLDSEASTWSRGIGIDVGGHEVPVDVPHNIPVRVEGDPVSVHELGKGMPITVYGHWDGKGRFHASRIDALAGSP